MKPIVKLKKLDPRATIPTYAHEGDSGMDLYSIQEHLIVPGARAGVDTGMSIEIPPGYEGQIRPRSGFAAKYGITVLNTPGTVDRIFRGSIKVILVNLGNTIAHVMPGDRIAQLVIAPVAQAEIVEVQELTETERGAGGLGSTGK